MATTAPSIMPSITAIPHGGIPSADHLANLALHPTASTALPLASALAPIFDSPTYQSLEAAQGLDDPALPGTKINAWYSAISDVLAAEPTNLQGDDVKEDVKQFLSEYFSVAGWKYPEAGRVGTVTAKAASAAAAVQTETVVTEVWTSEGKTITVQRLAPVSAGATQTSPRMVEVSQTAMIESEATKSAESTEVQATTAKITTSPATPVTPVTTGPLVGIVTSVVGANAACHVNCSELVKILGNTLVMYVVVWFSDLVLPGI